MISLPLMEKVLKSSIVRLNADIARYESEYTFYAKGANLASTNRDLALASLTEATEMLARIKDPDHKEEMEETVPQPVIPEELPKGPLDPAT